MRRSGLIVVMMLIAFGCISAMAAGDAELTALLKVVAGLRSGSKAAYDKASRELAGDKLWTPMNETGRVQKDVECLPADKVPGFKLNRILAKVEGDRVYTSTHGDMLNGEDDRYNYSLFERSVRKGKSVTYTLRGREGRQVFAIVPYRWSEGLSAVVTAGKEKYVAVPDKDGILMINAPLRHLTRNKTLTLTVTNHTTDDVAFVIINHNTWKR